MFCVNPISKSKKICVEKDWEAFHLSVVLLVGKEMMLYMFNDDVTVSINSHLSTIRNALI